MDNMAKYVSETDQEQVEKSRREQLAFKKELFEQKLKFNQLEGKSSKPKSRTKPRARGSSETAKAYDYNV